jgi:hypothetical protein
LFGTCRDVYGGGDNLLLFLSLNLVFMCVLTEQPSGQLRKQHKYNEITSNKRDEQSSVRERVDLCDGKHVSKYICMKNVIILIIVMILIATVNTII